MLKYALIGWDSRLTLRMLCLKSIRVLQKWGKTEVGVSLHVMRISHQRLRRVYESLGFFHIAQPIGTVVFFVSSSSLYSPNLLQKV